MATIIFDAATPSTILDEYLGLRFGREAHDVLFERGRYVVTLPRELKPDDAREMGDDLVAHAQLYCTADDGRVVWEASLERASELDSKAREKKHHELQKKISEAQKHKRDPLWAICRWISDCFGRRERVDASGKEPSAIYSSNLHRGLGWATGANEIAVSTARKIQDPGTELV